MKSFKRKLKSFNINPFIRISLGLVSLTICLILVGDLLLGLTSDERRALLDQRKKICETLAVQFSSLAEAGEIDTIETSMKSLVKGNSDVMSTALRDAEGALLASAGDHDKYWKAPGGDNSTPTHAQVPIFDGENRWGTVEVSFYEGDGMSLEVLTGDPLIRFLAFLAAGGFLGYMFFMKKTLKHLDPKAVIPDRVRSALDLLAEGVVMIDQKGDIVLANLAFAKKVGKEPSTLLGQSLTKMRWLSDDAKKSKVPDKELPWVKAMKAGDTQTEHMLSLKAEDDELKMFSINSSPIMDNNRNMRGAMATFNDQTALQQANSVLVDMMDKLTASQEKATSQNTELQRLATQDPLTNCLNRRAFFQQVEKEFAEIRTKGGPLSCIMGDIDRFKSINDKNGHGVGDQVIEQVAKSLLSSFGESGVICRYGGEEFCIIMPRVDIDQATRTAEQARAAIESGVPSKVKMKTKLDVTSSFGVSSVSQGAETLAELINQADKSLYAAKQAGRNCVRRWDQIRSEIAA